MSNETYPGHWSTLPIEEIVENNGRVDLRRATEDFGDAFQTRDPHGNPIALVRYDAATTRAERADEADLRALLRDVGNHLSTEHEVRHLHDHLGENLGCAGCALLENVRTALFGPTDTEGNDHG